MRISVVVTCFNYESFVGEAIRSVLASRRPADEVIVVDDGSTDRSASVVCRFPGITLLKQPNGGMASALNRGIRESSGDVVVFLDADDTMSVDRLGWIEEAFFDVGVVMAWHPLSIVDARGRIRGTCPDDPLPDGDLIDQTVRCGLGTFAVTSGIAVRRTLLDSIGPIPERFRNTAEAFVIRRALFEGRVAATSQTLGTYRVHADSFHRRRQDESLEALVEVLDRRMAFAVNEFQLIAEMAAAVGRAIDSSTFASRDKRFLDMTLARIRLLDPKSADSFRASVQQGLGAPSKYRQYVWVPTLALSYAALPTWAASWYFTTKFSIAEQTGWRSVAARCYWFMLKRRRRLRRWIISRLPSRRLAEP